MHAGPMHSHMKSEIWYALLWCRSEFRFRSMSATRAITPGARMASPCNGLCTLIAAMFHYYSLLLIDQHTCFSGVYMCCQSSIV